MIWLSQNDVVLDNAAIRTAICRFYAGPLFEFDPGASFRRRNNEKLATRKVLRLHVFLFG